jgi:hypothetical protein
VIPGKRRSGWSLYEDLGRGVYPPVERESVRKGMKAKRIRGFQSGHNGDDGREMY